MHSLDDVIADALLAQHDDFVDIRASPYAVRLDVSDDDGFTNTPTGHLDDFWIGYWAADGTWRGSCSGDGLVAVDDVRSALVAWWIMVGLLLIELLLLLFVCASLAF